MFPYSKIHNAQDRHLRREMREVSRGGERGERREESRGGERKATHEKRERDHIGQRERARERERQREREGESFG